MTQQKQAKASLPTSRQLLAMAQNANPPAPRPPARKAWSRGHQTPICPECEGAGLHRRRCSQFKPFETVPSAVAKRYTAMAWAGLEDARSGVFL